MIKDKHLSWQDIHATSDALAQMIKGDPEFADINGIVAVARGGLVPAGLLSNSLGIRKVSSISLIGYQGKQQRKELKLAESFNLDGGGAGWLFVDDLADHGRSLQYLRTKFPRAKFVTLFAKPIGQPFADMFAQEMDQDTWLHFPWEQDSRGKSFEAS